MNRYFLVWYTLLIFVLSYVIFFVLGEKYLARILIGTISIFIVTGAIWPFVEDYLEKKRESCLYWQLTDYQKLSVQHSEELVVLIKQLLKQYTFKGGTISKSIFHNEKDFSNAMFSLREKVRSKLPFWKN